MRYSIDTAEKFTIAAGLTFVNTLLHAGVTSYVEDWLKKLYDSEICRNNLRETDEIIQLYVFIYTVYKDLQRVLYVLFAFTNVYFVIIQLVAKLLAAAVTTNSYLTRKRLC
jgi:hypothetical protein